MIIRRLRRLGDIITRSSGGRRGAGGRAGGIDSVISVSFRLIIGTRAIIAGDLFLYRGHGTARDRFSNKA